MKNKLSFYGETGLAVAALSSSWVAFNVDWAGGAILIFVISMFGLSYCRSARRAFYWGLGIGTANAAMHLTFFFGLFSFGALALWSILGVWIALFTWLSCRARERWGLTASLLIPFFWVGFEYFRSELYPLKFSWLAPGMALSAPTWR